MGRLVVEGNPPIEVDIRRNARARRLTLRVSRLDGRATLTLPARVPEREARAFVQDRSGWLRAQLASVVPEQRPAFGQTLPFRGGRVTLVPGAGRGVRLDGDRLLAPPEADRLGPRLAGFLKTRAREVLVAACDRHAAALGRPHGRITLRDTRSRWGSCSARGDLMFSWRLIMAPTAVLDYVAAHEVAHLSHMDHSPAFWAAVTRLFPDHAGPRRWLREEGAALHRIRFD